MNAFDAPAHPPETLHSILGRHLVPMPESGAAVHLACIETPLGTLVAGSTATALCFLEFAEPARLEPQLDDVRRAFALPLAEHETGIHAQLRDELDAYFAGTLRAFRVPLDLPGTAFQQRVWETLLRIPHGQTLGYEDVARVIGSPKAVRAVGAANGRNRVCIVVPCHRLVGSSGKLVGYGGGLWRKKWLLELERGESPAAPNLSADPARSPPGTAADAGPPAPADAG